MVTKKGALGFCATPLHKISHASSQFSGTAVSPRRGPQQPLSVANAWPRTTAMSLTNELLFKGLEVGVATFLGNAVAVQQQSSAAAEPSKRRFFRSRNKKSRSKPPAPSRGLDASQLHGVVTELMRLAEGLPEVLERGGPEGKKWVKLAICIGIDLVGSGSLAVPILGDALDLVTAPLSAVMLQALFGNTMVTMGGLAEELLPGTDGIPTATLAWLAEYNGYLNAEKGGKTG